MTIVGASPSEKTKDYLLRRSSWLVYECRNPACEIHRPEGITRERWPSLDTPEERTKQERCPNCGTIGKVWWTSNEEEER